MSKTLSLPGWDGKVVRVTSSCFYSPSMAVLGAMSWSWQLPKVKVAGVNRLDMYQKEH